MPRDYVLHKTRTALGRSAGQPPAAAPDARIRIPAADADRRIESFACAVGKLAGNTHVVASHSAARDLVADLIAGKMAVASNAPFLRECGITALDGVRSGIADRDELRAVCASADVGITSADYALADTGSLVLFSSTEEARMISLLPPVHVAVAPRACLLAGLDELLSLVPRPADRSSSMLLITGPSRTADIEQILVRGVHGPGEIHVVIV